MTVVQTVSGKIEGTVEGALHVFRGIPFAEPPTGALRWRAPQPTRRWSGVRPAKEFGRQAWQPPPMGGALSGLMHSPVENDEDCLTLNVWTPGVDSRGRPVLVWIHGGAFSIGASAQPIYNGSMLAQRGDVVLVAINYRLGPLGFTRFVDVTNGAIPATGNEGLQDQVRALEWVRDNIERFGGDPDHVTIFGESAGGMSVGALLSAPVARGLFHRAIPQSGACSTAIAADEASELAAMLLESLKLKSGDARALQSVDPATLVTAGAMLQAASGRMAFQPCIDGQLLTQLPLDAVKSGSADGVSVMVGACADEWRLFVTAEPQANEMDEKTVQERLAIRCPAVDLRPLYEAYRDRLAATGAAPHPFDVFAAIETDRVFRVPAIRLAEALAARGQNPYHYEFTWRSPALEGKLGACHAIDIGFVFGTMHANDDIQAFCGTGPEVERLSRTVQDAWLSFARTGRPSSTTVGDWRAWTRTSFPTATFGDPVRLDPNVTTAARALWEGMPDGSVVGRL